MNSNNKFDVFHKLEGRVSAKTEEKGGYLHPSSIVSSWTAIIMIMMIS